MPLTFFEHVVKTEDSAKRYLKKLCQKSGRIFCGKCQNERFYRLSRDRLRCRLCRHEFHEITGRWLHGLRISCRQWLWIAKLFELELSSRRIAQQVGLSYPTVLKATTLLRRAILAHHPWEEGFLSGEVEADEAYFGGKRKGKRGRGAAGKVPVFGILERDGLVKVQVLKDVRAETLLTQTVRMVRRGSVVYTDKYKGYDSLMFCGYRHLQIDHQKRFASGKVYINGIEGFWSFAKERLIKHHGVSKGRFPLYLKEMEFRYNRRREPLFPILAQFLAAPAGN